MCHLEADMGTRNARKRNIIRSFSISSELVDEALRVVPSTVADNLNQMVTVALKGLVDEVKQRRFEEEMAKMAADPALKRESRRISDELRAAEGDGLP